MNLNSESNIGLALNSITSDLNRRINNEIYSRSYRASLALRNSVVDVFKGQKHGRIYNVPGTGRMVKDKIGLTYNYERHTARYVYGQSHMVYKKYRASAPGETPAIRTSTFRGSWFPKTKGKTINGVAEVHAMTESRLRTEKGYLLGNILEEGTPRMAPRPYKEKTKQIAMPEIRRIYGERYLT